MKDINMILLLGSSIGLNISLIIAMVIYIFFKEQEQDQE
jgi:preprotein translocase subunit SecF